LHHNNPTIEEQELELTLPKGCTIHLNKIGASINIGKIGTSRVSLGIEAPKEIDISRTSNVESE